MQSKTNTVSKDYTHTNLNPSSLLAYIYLINRGYSASGSTYGASGSGYNTAPASPYSHEESYNVHRNLEQAASKYQ